jgi:hypothetical protein
MNLSYHVSDLISGFISMEPSLDFADLRLAFGDRELLPDEVLSDCGIVHNSVVRPVTARSYKTWVWIVTPLDRLRHGLDLSDTAEQFIEQFAAGMDFCPAGLTFGGQLLPAGKSLRDCGVSEGSTLIAPSIKWISVRVVADSGSSGGADLRVRVAPTDTMADIKRNAQRLQGSLSSRQHLMYCGRRVKKDRTLQDCRIEPGHLLHLATRG